MAPRELSASMRGCRRIRLTASSFWLCPSHGGIILSRVMSACCPFRPSHLPTESGAATRNASTSCFRNTGGGVILYGSTDHANTRLTLNPGEWVRVIGKGHFTPGEEFLKRAMLEHPVDHVYVEASLYHDETLITPTQSATAGREVCLAQTHGQSLPIQLAIP
jgi:hypothetical protein